MEERKVEGWKRERENGRKEGKRKITRMHPGGKEKKCM